MSDAKKSQTNILKNINEVTFLLLLSMEEMQNSESVSGFEQFMKSLEEMSLSSAERARGSDRPITIQYTYMRNPILFMQTLKGTKTGKKLKLKY